MSLPFWTSNRQGKPLCSLTSRPQHQSPAPARGHPLQGSRHWRDTPLSRGPLMRNPHSCFKSPVPSPNLLPGFDLEPLSSTCGHGGRTFSRACRGMSSQDYRILDFSFSVPPPCQRREVGRELRGEKKVEGDGAAHTSLQSGNQGGLPGGGSLGPGPG